MSVKLTIWQTLMICLCVFSLLPVTSEASDWQGKKQHKGAQKQFLPGEPSPSGPLKRVPSKEQQKRKYDDHRKEQRQPEQRRSDHRDSHNRRDRHQPLPPHRENHRSEKRRHAEPYHRGSIKQRHARSAHDRHYRRYSTKHRRHPHHHHETYHYHTRYLAPIHRHYHPIGFRITFLPHAHVRIFIGGLPYFYYGGVYYRYYDSAYVVVRAPIGAIVHELPIGFITFYIGGQAYYYVNDVYYIWDDNYEAYVVVKKPRAAESAISEATEGRLFIYPNHGQSEEQQAQDRYECHRWAVSETRVDPSLEDGDELSEQERSNYKRAISACLEARDYTVK